MSDIQYDGSAQPVSEALEWSSIAARQAGIQHFHCPVRVPLATFQWLLSECGIRREKGRWSEEHQAFVYGEKRSDLLILQHINISVREDAGLTGNVIEIAPGFRVRVWA